MNRQAMGEEKEEKEEEAERRETGHDAAVVAQVGAGRREDSCNGGSGSRATCGAGILKQLLG